jgi:uroporphyrinogen decarboxylase
VDERVESYPFSEEQRMAASFDGLRITAFENSESAEIVPMIEKLGGVARPAPAVTDNPRSVQDAIDAIIADDTDIVVFTSAQQIHDMLGAAQNMSAEEPLREALKTALAASIGPTTSDALRDAEVGVDFEPDQERVEDLIHGLARCAHVLLHRKRSSHAAGVDTHHMRRIDAVWPKEETNHEVDLLHESPFLKACRRERGTYTPIWIMRQAGRYQRSYREIRSKVSFLELCKAPELAAEVTIAAVDELGVDAAIIFSDILLILEPMGVGLSFTAGDGPRIERPVRTGKDVDQLEHVDPRALNFVYDAIKITRRALKPDIPLIGFCGAPFTVASYLIEGGSSRNFTYTKMLMYSDPGAWHALLGRIVSESCAYLNYQIAAGAQAVQLFDSWVGCLSDEDYREFVLPHMRAMIARIHPGTPVIYFGTDTTVMVQSMKEAGVDVIGLDWRVNLAATWERIGYDVAVQGNLDPTVLLATPAEIRKRAHAILDQVAGRAGHIFNLGHGVLKQTPVVHVQTLVDAVHEYQAK